MKLTIRRNQADVKGLFGGHKGVMFSLFAKADISADERALIEKYKVSDAVLATCEFMRNGKPNEMRLTVDRLINGDTTTLADLAELQKWEGDIKSGCVTLKHNLEVMATFGGEEVIEI